jgi:cell division protein FtsI (penicillin-binding protein 3)
MNEEHIEMHGSDRGFGRRIGILMLLFAFFMTAIIAMLFKIQVVNGSIYKIQAARQYERVVTSTARRGDILDRHGRMLAESIESVSFYADPKVVRRTPLFDSKGRPVNDPRTRRQKTFDNSGAIATLFARHLGGSRATYLKELRRKRRNAVLGRKVPIAKALPLLQEKIPGVWNDREHQRYYLNVAAQLIGLTGSGNRGTSGLELQLDRELRGTDGTTIYQRTATGNRYPAPDARQEAAVTGNTVELTIDADIQSIVEDELAGIVERYNASAATGIVMNVRTGEVLAMANNPTFNLNDRTTWTGEKARNRSVTDSFEPGSTFKIVMATAATEKLGRKAEDMVYAHNGVMPIFNLRITDHEPYGNITFREAVMYSSNIVSANTAMEVGRETFYDYVCRFGFGKKTGIGLIGELPGFVRPLKKWDGTTLPWMGYGYQVTTTPLQILQAYAALANGGERMRPFIIRRIADAGGRTVRSFEPERVGRVMSEKSAAYIGTEYFKAVVDSGTAVSASLQGISVAGKTGTARRASGGSYRTAAYVSSFVGYFPVEDPLYAIIVLVEDPKPAYYASTVAAPSFRSIASRMIACSGEMQKNLSIRSSEQAELNRIVSVAVPELRGMPREEAERLLKWLGLSMEYSGPEDGLVRSQSEAPGTKVEERRKIRVTLAHSKRNRNPS